MSLSESKIYDAALHYLQRYASSVTQLRRVLQRKLLRAKMRGEDVPEEAQAWIEKAIEKCVKHNYVNDQQFAEQKIISLRRQGRSQSFIAQTLQQKGVDSALVKSLLGSDEEAELEAALRTAKRKRLGRDTTPEGRQKDLVKLLRAGFSMKAAKEALRAQDGHAVL